MSLVTARFERDVRHGIAVVAIACVVSSCGGAPPPSDGDEELFRSPEALTHARITNVAKWTGDYWRAYGRLPSTWDELGKLAILNLPPPARDSLSDPRRDAWGRPFQLVPQGEGFELRSNGPDGIASTDDDIVLVINEPGAVR